MDFSANGGPGPHDPQHRQHHDGPQRHRGGRRAHARRRRPLTVNDLTGTDLRTVDADLSGPLGGADGAADTVVANGTAAADVVKLTASGPQVISKGLFALTRITGADPALDLFRLNTLAGDDTVTTAAEVSTLIGTAVDLGADS